MFLYIYLTPFVILFSWLSKLSTKSRWQWQSNIDPVFYNNGKFHLWITVLLLISLVMLQNICLWDYYKSGSGPQTASSWLTSKLDLVVIFASWWHDRKILWDVRVHYSQNFSALLFSYSSENFQNSAEDEVGVTEEKYESRCKFILRICNVFYII